MYKYAATPFSLVMKEIVVPLWMHAECENKLQSNFGTAYKLAATSICAGERGHDACDVTRKNDSFIAVYFFTNILIG